MSAEESVMDVLTETVPVTTAKFLLSCLREEWSTKEAEKSECTHAAWRYVHDEPGVWNKCDMCEKRNVVVGG